MRVALDVTSSVKAERRGIANYAFELVRALLAEAPENDYRVCVRQNRWFKRHHVRGMVPGHKTRPLFRGFEGFALRDVDVFHGTGVRLPDVDRCARVVTLHDINVLEQPGLASSEWLAKRTARIRQTVPRADLVIVLSEQGARAVEHHLGVDPARLRIVPHGVDVARFHAASPAAVADVRARLGLGDGPYVAMLGALGARKNHEALFAAFGAASLPSDWKVALGGVPPNALVEIRATLESFGVDPERVVATGWIDDDDLPAFLSGAAILACPSRHEGFGLPVIEAQACGTPVIASNHGALPETVGDVGRVVDTADTDAFAAALVELADDAALRETLGRRGVERVRASFTWSQAARRTAAAYLDAHALWSAGRG